MNLYNTLTQPGNEQNSKEQHTQELKPLEDNKVRIYTCGLTVYSQPHIGNWVGYIYWDVLVRTLKLAGYDVERTQNYTDVGHLTSDDDNGEDKMEKGARREGITAWDVAEKYIQIAEHEAYELLGLLRPDHLVRATDYIDQQIAFVQELASKGYTYIIPGEGVYFDTSKLKDYGKLAKLDIKGLEAGARVSVAGKRNITDFALWKFSPTDQKRDMEWDSPWGKGFPGWHLECSVIARETLGDQIDIHTGGIDHIPVHHTNEIAQTEAITDKPFSQFWVHNNHMKADGTKMSKSLGNIYTLQDILDKGYSIDAFKLMVLSKHYRTEGNFTWDILEAAQNTLTNWNAWADLQFQELHSPNLGTNYDEALFAVQRELNDDLATPQTLAIINGMINRVDDLGADSGAIKKATSAIDDYFGLHLADRKGITPEQQQLIQDRYTARTVKDWAKSDELRDTLKEQGIAVQDTDSSTVWYRF
jgi:cysteinyl-tRNA synthetase